MQIYLKRIIAFRIVVLKSDEIIKKFKRQHSVNSYLAASLKAMCHTDVVAPIVTNRFPYFRRTSSFIDSKQSGLLLS